ncbi:cytochrome c maturation protein CcmE [Pacificispira sp.]|uniref:cytochrome c maturation protein CcmE n=1 Tax=Pacificispira sp. TaxID=2888761 RepID=UPI003B528E54
MSETAARRRSPAAQRKRMRLILVVCGVTFLGAATALTLTALQSNVNLFFGPTEVVEGKVPAGSTFRIGGLVEIGSCRIRGDGVTREFVVTDGANRVTVTYEGILPSLFRDGQGVVALGQLADAVGEFRAEEVLAKHDETYMPAEAVEAMKRAGTWQEGGGETVADAGAPSGANPCKG